MVKIRGPLDDQDDLGPTGFDLLLFLNMFKNSSRFLKFKVPDSIRTEAITLVFPRNAKGSADDCPQNPDFYHKNAADQLKIGILYSRDQNNHWWF